MQSPLYMVSVCLLFKLLLHPCCIYLLAKVTLRTAPLPISVRSRLCRATPACASVSYSTNATSGRLGTERKSWKPGWRRKREARTGEEERPGGMFWTKRILLGRRTSGPEIDTDWRALGFPVINLVKSWRRVTRGVLERSIRSDSLIFLSTSKLFPAVPSSRITRSERKRAYLITRLFPQILVPWSDLSALSASACSLKTIQACPFIAVPFRRIGDPLRGPKALKRSLRRGGRCLCG